MQQPILHQALQTAIRHHEAGRLAEAEHLYRQILTRQPNHAQSLHLLGVIAHQVGCHTEAVDLISRAIAILPDNDAAFHCNLGEAYRFLGQFDLAIAAYSRAIQLKPDYAAAYSNMGIVFNEKDRGDEAIRCFSRAIQLQPTTEAYNNLGIALAGLGRLDQAVAAYFRAIQMKPDSAEAFSNLANVYRHQGNFDEAFAAYARAISLKPQFVSAYVNYGSALIDRGQPGEAITVLSAAVRLHPADALVRNNLGIALNAQRKYDAAAAAFSEAIRLKSDYAPAWYNLANVRKEQGSLDSAIGLYLKAIELQPDYPEAFSNMGNARMAQGLLDDALACYDQSIALRPCDPALHGNRLYALHYHPSHDGRSILREHLAWGHLHARPLQLKIRPHENERSPDRRLRIGYVAPDFRDHCQSLFTIPLLSHHDRDHFEVLCYSGVLIPDAVTERIKRCADVWRNIAGMSDDAVAELIRQDKIDILIDLTLHMSGNRLLVFARKPAPVQVIWLGYPSTTGLATIDYRFSDPYLDPPDVNPPVQDEFYVERTLRLPDTFWCYDPLTSEPAVNDLPALAKGRITFGCLNNFCKVNETVLDLWAGVLKAVPDSRLMLLAAEGSHRQRTRESVAMRQIDPERIEFVEYRPRNEYLEHYHRIDIGLDTFPYNGHTTSLDSFWMGVPVVTLAGQTAVGRAGLSQLGNLKLTELIAPTPQQYVEIATRLAEDLPHLAELRGQLRGRMKASPLMDAERFARNIEAAYRQIWRHWCGERS
jgi:predicted O-linked N-acetylglucosamine transferase (SPINDLY family)